MKKILITTLNLHYNKINNALMDFISTIDLKKYEIDILAMETGEIILDLDPRINILYYKDYMLMPNKFLYNFKKKVMVKDLYDQFRYAFKKEYDIAIAYYGDNNYIDMVVPAIRAYKKIIWVQDVPDSVSGIYKNKLSEKYSYFDQIVFTTKSNMNKYKILMPQHKDKFICINNFVDYKRILKLAKEKTKITLDGEYKIVNITNMDRPNKLDKLIDIHVYLKDRGIDVKTYVIGDGKYSYKAIERIKKYNVASSFVLLGRQSNPYNILDQADLYVNISDSNKFNSTLLECSILDIPFVTNDTEANIDIMNILGKEAGKLVRVDQMYETIFKKTKSKKKDSEFNYKKYTKDVEKQIEDLLKID